MGPSRPRNSTRAAQARSVKSVPETRRKPASPKPSKLRTAADVLRDLRERQAGATLRIARAAEPARTEQEPLPATGVALREIRDDLDLICSSAIVVQHALIEQNAELDKDAALVLRWHVSDPLYLLVLRINHLLGDPAGDEDDDDDDEDEESRL
jgi:hypothetical protein